MPEPVPAQPTLYDADGPDPPRLHGRRCTECGYVFFPPHDYGCERCGARPELVRPVEVAGVGTLQASATVRLHPARDAEVPFTVGTIVLDDGPAIRATLACPPGEAPPPGSRVRSVLIPAGKDASGGEVVELRFEPGPDPEGPPPDAPGGAGEGG